MGFCQAREKKREKGVESVFKGMIIMRPRPGEKGQLRPCWRGGVRNNGVSNGQ